MDGLLSPVCSNGAVLLEVPYFAGIAQARSQAAWNADPPIATDLRENLQPLVPEEQAACTQSQMFFGLLKQFFGGQIEEQDFISADRNHIVIRPPVVSQAILHWNARLASLHMGQREKFQNLRTLLDKAGTQCDQIDYSATGDKSSPEWIKYGAVLLSVRLLLDYLHSALETAERAWLAASAKIGSSPQRSSNQGYYKLTAHAKAPSAIQVLPPGGRVTITIRIILDLFEKNGWCAVQAQNICQRANYAEAVSLSRIKQPTSSKDHVRCSAEGRCVAFDLSRQEMYHYARDHAHQRDCPTDCESIGGPLTQKLHNIIEAGKIPIMSIDPSVPDLDLRITENDGTRPYTAISHVWSDGLGNPQRNELRYCKLSNLRNVLRNTKEKRKLASTGLERYYTTTENIILFPRTRNRLYFWLDTFCIPTDPTKSTLKKMAMRHITPIFQGAEEVVILDADLQKYEPRKQESHWDVSFKEDIIAHILASKWIKRAWTLEEGALARGCQVQLAGDLVQLDQITRREVDWFSIQLGKLWRKEIRISQIKGPPLFQISLNSMLTDALNEYRKQAVRSGRRADIQRGIRNFEKTRSSQFASAWNELLERSSTRQDDRVLILGNILDFDAVKLGALPTKERLPLLIESCAQIPMSLMFNTETNLTSTVHPSRSWLPTGIHGDRLVDSAVITVTVSKESGQCTYTSDLRDMICIRLDVLIPRQVRNFCVNNAENRPKLVLELSPDYSISARDEQYHNTGCATYLVIDPASGTKSLNGYVGRGARFNIRASQSETVLLGFDRPLKAWSIEQWRYKTGCELRLPTYKESIYPTDSNIVELELGECIDLSRQCEADNVHTSAQ